MTAQPIPHERVHAFLDAVRSGDTLTVTRQNADGSLYSNVAGPVICAPDVSPAVGIDQLNGDPILVRGEDRSLWGDFIGIAITSGRQA